MLQDLLNFTDPLFTMAKPKFPSHLFYETISTRFILNKLKNFYVQKTSGIEKKHNFSEMNEILNILKATLIFLNTGEILKKYKINVILEVEIVDFLVFGVEKLNIRNEIDVVKAVKERLSDYTRQAYMTKSDNLSIDNTKLDSKWGRSTTLDKTHLNEKGIEKMQDLGSCIKKGLNDYYKTFDGFLKDATVPKVFYEHVFSEIKSDTERSSKDTSKICKEENESKLTSEINNDYIKLPFLELQRLMKIFLEKEDVSNFNVLFDDNFLILENKFLKFNLCLCGDLKEPFWKIMNGFVKVKDGIRKDEVSTAEEGEKGSNEERNVSVKGSIVYNELYIFSNFTIADLQNFSSFYASSLRLSKIYKKLKNANAKYTFLGNFENFEFTFYDITIIGKLKDNKKRLKLIIKKREKVTEKVIEKISEYKKEIESKIREDFIDILRSNEKSITARNLTEMKKFNRLKISSGDKKDMAESGAEMRYTAKDGTKNKSKNANDLIKDATKNNTEGNNIDNNIRANNTLHENTGKNSQEKKDTAKIDIAQSHIASFSNANRADAAFIERFLSKVKFTFKKGITYKKRMQNSVEDLLSLFYAKNLKKKLKINFEELKKRQFLFFLEDRKISVRKNDYFILLKIEKLFLQKFALKFFVGKFFGNYKKSFEVKNLFFGDFVEFTKFNKFFRDNFDFLIFLYDFRKFEFEIKNSFKIEYKSIKMEIQKVFCDQSCAQNINASHAHNFNANSVNISHKSDLFFKVIVHNEENTSKETAIITDSLLYLCDLMNFYVLKHKLMKSFGCKDLRTCFTECKDSHSCFTECKDTHACFTSSFVVTVKKETKKRFDFTVIFDKTTKIESENKNFEKMANFAVKNDSFLDFLFCFNDLFFYEFFVNCIAENVFVFNDKFEVKILNRNFVYIENFGRVKKNEIGTKMEIKEMT